MKNNETKSEDLSKRQELKVAKAILRWGAAMDYFQSGVAMLPSDMKIHISEEVARRDQHRKYNLHHRINKGSCTIKRG